MDYAVYSILGLLIIRLLFGLYVNSKCCVKAIEENDPFDGWYDVGNFFNIILSPINFYIWTAKGVINKLKKMRVKRGN